VWTHEKVRWFCKNRYLDQGWLSWSLLRLCQRPPKMVKEMHTFHLDLSLLYLKVCSSTFIRLKVLTRLAQNLKIQWWMVRDKMLKTFIEALDVLLFSKKPVSFGGLELYNELLKDANTIIQNYQGRRWKVGKRRIV